jgi:hypothetical protein
MVDYCSPAAQVAFRSDIPMLKCLYCKYELNTCQHGRGNKRCRRTRIINQFVKGAGGRGAAGEQEKIERAMFFVQNAE